ncbi:MAG: hypothetical protein II978_01095 [Clostridia bacterium]|nr:hypothetical protein [Clostridia bacterium]
MKYSIGYQLPDELDTTLEICKDFNEHISDVFFSWGNEPNGRSPLGRDDEKEIIEKVQLEELKSIKSLGKTLTLLLNANCYGEDGASLKHKNHILGLVKYLKENIDIDYITTASPFIADVLKEKYGNDIHIKASVNMRIGSVSAMRQLKSSFDSFYIKKEINRDFDKIKELDGWCKANGKKLHMLANSGCLTDCAFQTFHDNLIAHQKPDADYGLNVGYPAPCHKYLKSLDGMDGITEFMRSNWIRPEDIHHYEEHFDEVKLATRMHSRPRMVIAAYCREKFKGNLLDLTEPSYSQLFKGYVIDNTLIPKEWFKLSTECKKKCDECNVCKNALKSSLVKYTE